MLEAQRISLKNAYIHWVGNSVEMDLSGAFTFSLACGSVSAFDLGN